MSGPAPDAFEPPPRDWTEAEGMALGLWIALARCYSTYSKAVQAVVLERDLTLPQFGALEALYHLGPLSLGELADKLLVTGGNVTYVMDRLEGQGLVARYRSETDRRVVHARLTDEGKAMVASVFPEHARYIAHLCRHLEPQEQEQLRMLLKKLGKGVAREDLKK
jgi:MarR family 2-MHQ and catechol resistance regulon transcriptional repressor